MTAGATPWTVCAIPAAELERTREEGVDRFGNSLLACPAEAGTPLRCCLREAEEGERVALIAYQPAAVGGPYAEVGPVFIHADSCAGYTDRPAYPDAFRPRPQLLRSYDASGRITDAVIVDGADAEDAIDRLFARPEVDFLHSRNVLWGCYMFAVRRT